MMIAAFIVGALVVLVLTAIALDRITDWLEGYWWPTWALMLVAVAGASMAGGIIVFGAKAIWG